MKKLLIFLLAIVFFAPAVACDSGEKEEKFAGEPIAFNASSAEIGLFECYETEFREQPQYPEKIDYKTDDASVCEVTSDGRIYTTGEGETYVTASSGQYSTRIKVKVEETAISAICDKTYHNQFADRDGKPHMQWYEDTAAREVMLGYDPISAAYNPLLLKTAEKVKVVANRPEWVILWADADNDIFFAVNLSPLVDEPFSSGFCPEAEFGSAAIFSLNEKDMMLRFGKTYAKDVFPEIRPLPIDKPFTIEYNPKNKTYTIADEAGILFSLNYDVAVKSFNPLAELEQQIGFIATNHSSSFYKFGDEPYTCRGEDKSLSDKRMLILGDSIMHGGSMLVSLLKQELGLAGLDNAGIGGAALSDAQKGGLTVKHSVVDRVKKDVFDFDSYDIIAVFGGSNDFNNAIPIGTLNSDDTSTVYGAVNFLIDTLRMKAPNAKLIFLTPLIRTDTVPPIVQGGPSNTDVRNTILDVCQKKGVYCVDMYECGIDETNVTQYTTDTVHPNFEGYKLLADYLFPEILNAYKG